jgi:N-hydroxyarylamine O-acetyltransferase
MFQLDAYLARINYHDRRSANAGVLCALHEAHAASIPFENIDVLLGRPIRLDVVSLESKLVGARRGGYCFEQNELFASALEALRFKVTRLAARVRYRSPKVLPRTHMVLRVDVGNEAWLADVGFGGEGPFHPIRMRDGELSRQSAWTYRLVREGAAWVLRLQHEHTAADLYSFTEEPQLPVDYEVANWYTSTYPESIFVKTLTVQRSTHAARLILRNFEYTIDRGSGTPQRSRIANEEELWTLLRERFGIVIPGEVKLPELQSLSV